MKHIYELQRIDIWGRRYPQRRTNIASMGFFSTQENAVDSWLWLFYQSQSTLGHIVRFQYPTCEIRFKLGLR